MQVEHSFMCINSQSHVYRHFQNSYVQHSSSSAPATFAIVVITEMLISNDEKKKEILLNNHSSNNIYQQKNWVVWLYTCNISVHQSSVHQEILSHFVASWETPSQMNLICSLWNLVPVCFLTLRRLLRHAQTTLLLNAIRRNNFLFYISVYTIQVVSNCQADKILNQEHDETRIVLTLNTLWGWIKAYKGKMCHNLLL